MKELYKILTDNQPFIILLIGTPLLGKSSFIKEYFNNSDINCTEYTIISRDDILMTIAENKNYDEAYKIISSGEKQKIVDKILKAKLINLGRLKKNVIIDMCNLRVNGRRKHLAKFPKHFKLAITFDNLTDEEYIKRNNKRIVDENKNISMELIHEMIVDYQHINDEEGFDLIINRKQLK